MHKLLGALSCVLSLVDASQKFPQLKYIRRDGLSFNETGDNSKSILPTLPTSSLTPTVPAPTNNTSYSNTSSFTTPGQESCSGSITYFNSVPPTVYATITETYAVTVTASNASLPPPELTTPPVYCIATVIPASVSEVPLASNSNLDPASPEAATRSIGCIGVCFPGSASQTSASLSFQPALTVITLSLEPAATPATSVIASSHNVPQIASTEAPAPSESPAAETGSAFTSTVFVTKKTAVPVVVPPTSAPPVFQIPSTTKKPTTTPAPSAGVGSPIQPPSSPSTNGGTSKAPTSNPLVVSQQPATTKIGSIIASIINVPFTPVGSDTSTSKVPAPVTTNVDNVPVQILPSSVIIGGQAISIPGTSSKTTLQVNGQTFTVQNSQIIAPGTTFAIAPERNQEGTATATPSPVTAGGLTFSVDASQAIISGTTFAIGTGAGSSTTVTIGTKTLTIGSGGVILPSTTVAPIQITEAPIAPEVITAQGLTFTVGPSFAVISGSTYTIGPGAKPTTIVVGSRTISLGNNGIGLATTTIAPEPSFTVVTVGGLTFSVDSTEAILKGTTYKIGQGASTETMVVGGKTISIGPNGVGLPSLSTTIPPATGGATSPTGVAALAVPALFVGVGVVFL